MTVVIDRTCTACGLCLVTCPTRALLPAVGRPAVVDARCIDCWSCLEVCPVDAIRPVPDPSAPDPSGPGTPGVHPIEAESYRILERRVDLTTWPEVSRAVVARVIHSTADEGFATSMRIGGDAVAAAVAALRRGAPVVCDAHMLRVGLTRLDAHCLLDEVPTAPPGTTRSAAAFALAADRFPEGALWVVGNAPTALDELLRLASADRVRPAAVVGLPVGFVGAKEAKAALWAGDLRSRAITNEGERGGTPAAAGAVNALVRLARTMQ